MRGAQRASLDDQLQATADAVQIVGDVKGEDIVVDANEKDKEAFEEFLTAD